MEGSLNGVGTGGREDYFYGMRKNRFLLVVAGLLAALLTGGLTGRVLGQASMPVHRMDMALLAFFNGRWTGEGAFANGRKIAAEVSFGLSLDSCWIVYEHRDRPPNGYKATSMWGFDGTTGEFFAYIFDNFHGHRQLAGNGWKEGRLLISGQSFIPGVGLYFEHFLYERLSDSQFKMTYETSRDVKPFLKDM
jgi:hypothetical protein